MNLGVNGRCQKLTLGGTKSEVVLLSSHGMDEISMTCASEQPKDIPYSCTFITSSNCVINDFVQINSSMIIYHRICFARKRDHF